MHQSDGVAIDCRRRRSLSLGRRPLSTRRGRASRRRSIDRRGIQSRRVFFFCSLFFLVHARPPESTRNSIRPRRCIRNFFHPFVILRFLAEKVFCWLITTSNTSLLFLQVKLVASILKDAEELSCVQREGRKAGKSINVGGVHLVGRVQHLGRRSDVSIGRLEKRRENRSKLMVSTL